MPAETALRNAELTPKAQKLSDECRLFLGVKTRGAPAAPTRSA